MSRAAGYIARIRALILAHPFVSHWSIVREEVQGHIGLIRYRLILQDGGLLEMFERFECSEDRVRVVRYSFHWQDARGRLQKRWDNAAHHPELATQPHHVHDGAEANVLEHLPVTAADVLASIPSTTDSA